MSEQKDFESRLRDALRADGDNAQLDAGALGKIRGRLAEPRRRPVKRVIAFGVMAAAAACTAAIIVVPQLAGPSHLDGASTFGRSQAESGPEAEVQSKQQALPQRRSASPAPTESTLNSLDEAAATLGELTVGKDLRVTLTYTHILGDKASVTLWAYRATGNGSLEAAAGSAAVGEPDQWTYSSGPEPKLCEFRVTQAPNQPATVRVRLAEGGGCSDAYVYEVDGQTLKPKSS